MEENLSLEGRPEVIFYGYDLAPLWFPSNDWHNQESKWLQKRFKIKK